MAGILQGNANGIGIATIAWTPASVAAATTAEQTVAVPGIRPGDYVDVTAPGITAGIGVSQARATANNAVAVTFVNSTAGALVPPAGQWQVLWLRTEGPRGAVVT